MPEKFTTDQITLAVEIPGLYDGAAFYPLKDGTLVNRFAHTEWHGYRGGRLRVQVDAWIAEHGDTLRARHIDLLDGGDADA